MHGAPPESQERELCRGPLGCGRALAEKTGKPRARRGRCGGCNGRYEGYRPNGILPQGRWAGEEELGAGGAPVWNARKNASV